jgi:antibiotic biosynthesis monooxygenase (ABM) superfamily enzyme
MTAAIPEHDLPGLLLSCRVARRDAARCVDLVTRMRDDAGSAAGVVSWDIIRRDVGPGTDVHALLRFASPRAMSAFRSHPAQRARMAELEAMAPSGIAQQEARGSRGSFDLATASDAPPPVPPLWKRWTVSMLAVYPALVLLVVLLDPVTARLPAPLGLFVVALVLTGLNTAFLLPWLNTYLKGWLAQGTTAARHHQRPRGTLLSRLRP